MTRSYSQMNQHDALYSAAREYPGGIEALAGRMGMSVNVLRNKLAPGVKTHHVTFEEASLIVEFLHEAKVDSAHLPLMAMNWRHHLVAYAVPSIDALKDDELANGLFNVAQELGDVARVMNESLGDKIITPAELDRTMKEGSQLMAAAARWLAFYQEQYDRQTTTLRVA